jgi:hypothetical protein
VSLLALIGTIPVRSLSRQNPADAAPTIADLAWFAGNWETDQNGRRVEEYWTKPEGGTMIGMGRTVRGDSTTSFEYFRLESRPDGIYYVAQPQGRPGVDFKLASLHGEEATFVNPGHEDHLKKIIYRRNADGSMTARIEGEDAGKSFSHEWQYHLQEK